MVGVCAASWLQRDGHSVFLIEAAEPGHGASFGNAGCFNGSSVTPVAMPGVIRSVPGWLFDPLAPLALRWTYLPTIAPWLLALHPGRHAGEGAGGGPCLATARRADPRNAEAARQRCRRRRSRPSSRPSLCVSVASRASRRIAPAGSLRRENGVEIDEFDADELRQLEPALSREYVRGLAGARERPYLEPARPD